MRFKRVVAIGIVAIVSVGVVSCASTTESAGNGARILGTGHSIRGATRRAAAF